MINLKLKKPHIKLTRISEFYKSHDGFTLGRANRAFQNFRSRKLEKARDSRDDFIITLAKRCLGMSIGIKATREALTSTGLTACIIGTPTEYLKHEMNMTGFVTSYFENVEALEKETPVPPAVLILLDNQDRDTYYHLQPFLHERGCLIIRHIALPSAESPFLSLDEDYGFLGLVNKPSQTQEEVPQTIEESIFDDEDQFFDDEEV